MEERMPVYMHLPLQVLWFDTSEVTVIIVFYLAAMIFGGVMWYLLIIGPYALISFTRSQARGYIKHLMYVFGWTNIVGYPNPSAMRFCE
jgi:hypothetical protein